MASQLENELSFIKQCWGVYEQSSIVNSVRVDDWIPELAIIASNEVVKFLPVLFNSPQKS